MTRVYSEAAPSDQKIPSDTDDVQEEQYNDVPFEPKIEEVD